MGEQEEESGWTWLAALTLIEAGEIGGLVFVVVRVGGIDTSARVLYVICNKKEGRTQQPDFYF